MLYPVGLWRSWERASMAWKRSSVRSRSGPPNRSLKSKHLQEAGSLPRTSKATPVAEMRSSSTLSLQAPANWDTLEPAERCLAKVLPLASPARIREHGSHSPSRDLVRVWHLCPLTLAVCLRPDRNGSHPKSEQRPGRSHGSTPAFAPNSAVDAVAGAPLLLRSNANSESESSLIQWRCTASKEPRPA